MRKVIFYGTSIFIFVVLLFLIVFWWQIRTPLDSISGKTVIFKVEKGDSAKTVAVNLKKAELIKSSFKFRPVLQAWPPPVVLQFALN